MLTRDEFPKVRHEAQRDMHRTNRHGTRTRSATKSETGRQATISNVLRIVVHSDYPTTATLTRSFSSGPPLEVGVKSGVCCSQNTWDSSSIGPKSIVRAWPITAGHPARHKLGTRCSLMFSNASDHLEHAPPLWLTKRCSSRSRTMYQAPILSAVLRGAEMRASSKELKDNNAVAGILRLADLYDRLADRAEIRQAYGFTRTGLRAFLVRDDEFFNPRFDSISSYDVEQVKGTYADLYVIGFVDYIDQFAERRLAQLRHAIWIVDPRKIRDQIICLKSGPTPAWRCRSVSRMRLRQRLPFDPILISNRIWAK